MPSRHSESQYQVSAYISVSVEPPCLFNSQNSELQRKLHNVITVNVIVRFIWSNWPRLSKSLITHAYLCIDLVWLVIVIIGLILSVYFGPQRNIKIEMIIESKLFLEMKNEIKKLICFSLFRSRRSSLEQGRTHSVRSRIRLFDPFNGSIRKSGSRKSSGPGNSQSSFI
jgi:hypothetical protein